MANGKGALACQYCTWLSEHHCGFHSVELPVSKKKWNLICANFEPSDGYWRDNGEHSPPARRFAWFGCDLAPGVLYHFMYNAPESIEELATLRTPNYATQGWDNIER